MITKPVLPVQQATCVAAAAAVAALKTNFLNNQKGFKSEPRSFEIREVVFNQKLRFKKIEKLVEVERPGC